MTSADFTHLVSRHSEFLYPFAYSLTNDQEEAKDLFQDTMLRALANRDKYQFGTNLKAWLYTVMRNIFINSYRRKKKLRGIEKQQQHAEWLNDQSIGNVGWNRLRLKEINEALNRLPESLRLSFELYYTGYKYQEIAVLLQEPLGTVKSRIHFARKTLISQLDR